MRWNTQKLKAGEFLKKNKLYELTAEQPVATFVERHDDSEPEIVDMQFQIPENGSAVVANEYRNKDYANSKTADILCILLDEPGKKLSTHIYDIKRTMTGYDMTKSVKELRREAVKRIMDFIGQMQDSMIHKEGLTALYQHDGYTETVELGIVTREFDTEKIKRLAERLESGLEEPAAIHGAIGQKYYMATQPLRKEIEVVKNFRDRKIKILGQMYDLQVFLLKYSEKKHAYYQKIVIGGYGYVK